MTIINLEIKPGNERAHADIEELFTKHKGKLLHFELRYSGGTIVDLVVRAFKTYESLTKSVK
jgi:hypothetical protein